MKKIMGIFVLIFLLSSCDTADPNDILVIEERFFINRMNDIVFNLDSYIGTTIRYEGVFRTLEWPESQIGYFHQVYRYVEGCCGPDGVLGLDVRLNYVDIEPFEDSAWVRVTGVIGSFEEGGRTFPRVNVTHIEELEERGNDFISS